MTAPHLEVENLSVAYGPAVALDDLSLAAARGIKTLLLGSGEAAFRAAFLEADKVASARAVEKEKTQQFQVLIDYSIDGIISVDRDRKIRVFNPSAQKILGRAAETVTGADVATVLAGRQVAEDRAESDPLEYGHGNDTRRQQRHHLYEFAAVGNLSRHACLRMPGGVALAHPGFERTIGIRSGREQGKSPAGAAFRPTGRSLRVR